MITASVGAGSEATLAALADLGTYPEWLPLVAAAERVARSGDEHPVWLVTLRAQIGPFARSKRLRMQRTSIDATSIGFERVEVDGRNHAVWRLDVSVEPDGETTSDVAVRFRYDGSFWSAPIDAALAAAEDSAARRLTSWLQGQR